MNTQVQAVFLPAVSSLLVDLGIFFSEVSDLADFLSRVP